MAALVGNGILVGFAGQAALSLGLSAWVFFLTTHGNIDVVHPEGSVQREIERKRLDFVSSILMIGSDIQLTLGIAYMITVFSQVQLIDTYHLHLVFDIVSFVGVSNTAALVCWRFCRAKIDSPDTKRPSGRHSKRITDFMSYFRGHYRATFLYIALYLALTILLCIRLNDWAPNKEPGRCYHTHLVTNITASHPASDQIYVAVTSSWLIVVTIAGVFGGVRRRRGILLFSSLHFPLHLYMAIALRKANDGKLDGDNKQENDWDFGQTTAVVLLGVAIVELLSKGKEYYDFEKHAAKNGKSRHASDRSLQEAEDGNSTGYLLDTLPSYGHTPEERLPVTKG
ncbi:hypothetical protein BGW36DRAFT_289063 [Talaromyces proteolyticus]|uniref:Uncharacterized protein n=1 Tax=Talaromyces proteolyticus TaxID=1131652 RepID=A0AAD4Q5C9_9EURO|nr:uncharacterized protein BGW36DRAFT_289063 [Talaromyces proteolyticus]KAH8703895.1 hypothetical protein BGW36DRAFT_289063 [Talaromyces proteolyticus]